MGECLVLTSQKSEAGRKKLTEHEVPEGAAPGILIRSNRKALDFSGRRSITLPRVRHVVAQVIV